MATKNPVPDDEKDVPESVHRGWEVNEGLTVALLELRPIVNAQIPDLEVANRALFSAKGAMVDAFTGHWGMLMNTETASKNRARAEGTLGCLHRADLVWMALLHPSVPIKGRPVQVWLDLLLAKQGGQLGRDAFVQTVEDIAAHKWTEPSELAAKWLLAMAGAVSFASAALLERPDLWTTHHLAHG